MSLPAADRPAVIAGNAERTRSVRHEQPQVVVDREPVAVETVHFERSDAHKKTARATSHHMMVLVEPRDKLPSDITRSVNADVLQVRDNAFRGVREAVVVGLPLTKLS